jgi:ankyrin repeat protein
MSDRTEVVKLLLEKGANTEARTNGNFTVLMLTANEGMTGVMKLLLEKGANIDASNDGITVLSMAKKNDNPAAAELLRAHGAH